MDIQRTRSVSKRGRKGQAAVETVFMLPIFMLIFIGMYELFTVTYGAQNAHIRARENLLHHGRYTPSSRTPPYGNQRPGNPLFANGEYVVAQPDIWGVPGLVVGGNGLSGDFTAGAEDYGWGGIQGDGNRGGAHIEASLVICSPYGCP